MPHLREPGDDAFETVTAARELAARNHLASAVVADRRARHDDGSMPSRVPIAPAKPDAGARYRP